MSISRGTCSVASIVYLAYRQGKDCIIVLSIWCDYVLWGSYINCIMCSLLMLSIHYLIWEEIGRENRRKKMRSSLRVYFLNQVLSQQDFSDQDT